MIPLLFGLAMAGSDRQQEADRAFDQIMQMNSSVGAAPAKPARLAPETTEDAPTTLSQLRSEPVPKSPAPVSHSAKVEVPLERYEAVRARIAEADARAARSYDALVVLGASTWTGTEVEGGLSLRLSLQATLSGPGFWKSVPLVGEEVAVVSARVGGTPVPLTRQSGYQVWVTDTVGEVTLELDVLVPSRGPRGSLEYDFLVARTPVTRFDCTFPEAGLDPRLERAVRAEVTNDGGTTLRAWLEPTSRIHLVGYKDLGKEEGQPARLYVETTSLYSIEEREAELFSVMRYGILQAGARQFDILVPPGLEVISADGAGAFRYTTEARPEGTVLHGETAFPIRDDYEISLRLSRTLDDGPLPLDVPRALGAERETGWVGVEVLGPVQVEEATREDAVSVDVAALPAELVGNAVSPVLKGWRYHGTSPKVALTTTRLPEHEPAAGAVDRVDAVTTIAAEGRARTELRITLRNRLRHSLRVQLPPGVTLQGFTLDGAPATASAAPDGTLLLPLRRSAGERPTPFVLALTLEGDVGAFWPLGARSIALPTLELPVRNLSWEVKAPATNRYTRLFGDVSPQTAIARDETMGDEAVLRHARWWVGAEQPVTVRFAWIRGWLVAPLGLLGAVGFALGSTRLRLDRRGIVLGLVALGALTAISPVWSMLGALGAAVVWWARGGAAVLTQAWADWRAVGEEPAPGSWRTLSRASRFGLACASVVLGFTLLISVIQVLQVLANPWG